MDRILAAACLGMLAVGANGTAIMAALPSMRQELGLQGSEIEWAINAYLIVSAACIVPGGKFSDLLGAHRVSIAGLALFGLASVVIALAASPAALLAGRALQGLGAAMAVPGTLAAIGRDPATRPARVGAWAGFLMLGFSIGPLMGGALTHGLGWRAIFWCNALFMVAATVGFMASPARSQPFRIAVLTGFDWVGFLAVAVFMVSAVSALQALPLMVQEPLRLLAPAAIAVAALWLALRTERRRQDPMLDLRVFGVADFMRAVAIGSTAMFTILTLLLYFNLSVQDPQGLRFSPIEAGLMLLPLSTGLLAFAFSAPALTRRFGARTVLAAAMLVMALAGGGVAAATAGGMLSALGVCLFLLGSALALPYATAPGLAMATLPASQGGQSSGIINACTFLGGSIGIAAGGIAFRFGGLSAVMALIAVLALAGMWLCLGMPRSERQGAVAASE